MAFREHPGFRVEVDPILRTPKGKVKRKRIKADRAPMSFTGAENTIERAIWLNPAFREESRKDILNHLGKGGEL